VAVDLEEQLIAGYAERVGERLRSVRKQKRLSLQAVEASSRQEFKASVLGAYERGERAISVPRLQRLARFYNVPVDQLLPRDLGPDLEPWIGEDDVDIDLAAEEVRDIQRSGAKITLDLQVLDRIDAVEKDLLRRYLGMIQVQRQDFNGRVLTIRGEDVKVLALMLETTPTALVRRLTDLDLVP
jgi:transcriptional regulator with XRE-family HTH domain